MRTRCGRLVCVLALVTVVSVLVLRLPAVSGQSQIWPGVPAVWPPWQNPDPPCFDNTTRYVNCGNGTVTDTATGFMWLQDAGCLGSLNWAEAESGRGRAGAWAMWVNGSVEAGRLAAAQ